MYKVKLLIWKETIEVEVDAKYCLVDGNNNLVFLDQLSALWDPEPKYIFSARHWISAEQIPWARSRS